MVTRDALKQWMSIHIWLLTVYSWLYCSTLWSQRIWIHCVNTTTKQTHLFTALDYNEEPIIWVKVTILWKVNDNNITNDLVPSPEWLLWLASALIIFIQNYPTSSVSTCSISILSVTLTSNWRTYSFQNSTDYLKLVNELLARYPTNFLNAMFSCRRQRSSIQTVLHVIKWMWLWWVIQYIISANTCS